MKVERPIVESAFTRVDRKPRLTCDLPALISACLEVPKRPPPLKLKWSHPLRAGKKCLILDVDLTLCKCVGQECTERPFLHRFLTEAYQQYDILIWSATSKARLKWKLRTMGVQGHRDYKINALLDKRAMGLLHCKPLRVIWDEWPQFYHPKNTIIVDDQTRNFKLNPQNGLTIAEFHPEKGKDDELPELADYLAYIAQQDDLSKFDHHRWKDYW